MRTKPISRATQLAIPTTGQAFAIPATAPIRQIKLKVSAAAYVGIGASASAPTAADTNTTYQESGELVYTLDGVPQTDGAYFYVYAVSGTIDGFVSYYG
jgi:hypothetical protein